MDNNSYSENEDEGIMIITESYSSGSRLSAARDLVHLEIRSKYSSMMLYKCLKNNNETIKRLIFKLNTYDYNDKSSIIKSVK